MPHLTSSPREGVILKSNQSEGTELYSVKNTQKSLSPTTNLKLISSNKIRNSSKIPTFQTKNMSKFDLPSRKQMETPIREKRRAETRQTVEMITTSRKRKRITTINRNKTNYARILANLRANRLKKTVRVNMIASKVGEKRTPEAPVTSDRTSFITGCNIRPEVHIDGK